MATDQECVGYALRDQLFTLAREWIAAAMHERDLLIFPSSRRA
jgi:hypothetical protein